MCSVFDRDLSGEQQRLELILLPELGRQSQLVTLQNGSTAELVCGATDQDDCAAYSLSGDSVLVMGSDYVRGVRFSLYELGYLQPYDLGWYLSSANFSDIAAMGARPLGLLSVVRYPPDMDDRDFGQVIAGIRDGAAACGGLNVGGDIGHAERLILSASAFGLVAPGRLLRRSGARPGQAVLLSGPTGVARAALVAARAGVLEELPTQLAEILLAPWRRARPRVRHAALFAKAEGVSSCIDTSDGLMAALEQLSSRSRVAVEVELDRIPVDEAVVGVAKRLSLALPDLVLGDSVDFELVCTVDEERAADLMRRASALGLDLFHIGRVADGSGVAVL
jgi:thiamine-monophosphate kinase